MLPPTLFLYLSIYLFTRLSIYLSICLFIYLLIYLSFSLTSFLSDICSTLSLCAFHLSSLLFVFSQIAADACASLYSLLPRQLYYVCNIAICICYTRAVSRVVEVARSAAKRGEIHTHRHTSYAKLRTLSFVLTFACLICYLFSHITLLFSSSSSLCLV